MERIILSIAGPVMFLLLGIIGYYIVRESRRQDSTNEKLFDALEKQRESTDKLNITLTALNGVILSLDERYNGLERRFVEYKEVCKYNRE